MRLLSNPYSFEQTIDKLQRYISGSAPASLFIDAVVLLKNAVEKSQTDPIYAKQLEEALLKGSTVECREVFSVFGEYLDCTRRDTEPFYPHRHAVNVIDTALYYLKMGFVDDECKRKEVPDLDNFKSLEISAIVANPLRDGIQDFTALIGVASGRVSLQQFAVDENLSNLIYVVNARDVNGNLEAIHQSDTLEQAYAVSRFVKGCNFHLLIEAN